MTDVILALAIIVVAVGQVLAGLAVIRLRRRVDVGQAVLRELIDHIEAVGKQTGPRP